MSIYDEDTEPIEPISINPVVAALLRLEHSSTLNTCHQDADLIRRVLEGVCEPDMAAALLLVRSAECEFQAAEKRFNAAHAAYIATGFNFYTQAGATFKAATSLYNAASKGLKTAHANLSAILLYRYQHLSDGDLRGITHNG